MAGFNAISELFTIINALDPSNISNLTVKPDLLRNARGTYSSTVQLLITPGGSNMVADNDNGTYSDPRYTIFARLSMQSYYDYSEQLFLDIIAEWQKLFFDNNVNNTSKTADFSLEYENNLDEQNMIIRFYVDRFGVEQVGVT
jgi:hypothetical protein